MERSDSIDQREAYDIADPNDVDEPMERIEATEPTLPIDITDPALAMDRIEPRDPMLSNESCDHKDHFELAQVTGIRSS